MSLEGQQLGEFAILERIGQGGMGAVYKARQTSLGRFVALKTLQTSLANDADYIARFQQEARAAAVLNHTNLVQVISAGQNEGLHWFAMEYVDGESAKVRLKRKGQLDPLEAIAIAIHVATALEYGWRKAHLIHRDIKPDNIFLSTDGEVKLGDLGLAKTLEQNQGLTTTGASMGTPHYISPEQVEAMKDVDLRADIYSLGCTLYHLLSGQPPFDGNSAVSIMLKHVNAPVPDLRAAWARCPDELAGVVAKMMQKSPDDRQQKYAEVIADLRRAYDAMSGNSVPVVLDVTQRKAEAPAKPVVPAAPPPASHKTRTALAVGALVTILAVGLAGYFFWKARPRPSPPAPPSPAGPRSDWSKAINLLRVIAPADAVMGTWVIRDGRLESDTFPHGRLQVPYEPPEEYDYRVVFSYGALATPMTSGEVSQYLSKGGRSFRWVMGADTGKFSAFEIIRGANGASTANPTRTERSPVITRSAPHTSIVEVRNDGVKAYLDGELAAEWKTDYQDMTTNPGWALHNQKLLGVGSYQTAVKIEKLDVYEITGKGKILR